MKIVAVYRCRRDQEVVVRSGLAASTQLLFSTVSFQLVHSCLTFLQCTAVRIRKRSEDVYRQNVCVCGSDTIVEWKMGVGAQM